jgi:hypothetical protein
VIILLGLIPFLLLSVFVICEVREVITVCMYCTEVISLSVPYIFLSATMSDHFFSIFEVSFTLHSVVLSIIYNLEAMDDNVSHLGLGRHYITPEVHQNPI